MRRRLVVLLAVMATGLALGSGVALSAPASSPDAQADSAIEPRIIEGTPVPNGKYRYVAALLNKKRDGGAYQQQFCGGTLIDRNSVLTAAHCFGNNSNPRNFRVVLGRADLTSNRGVVRDVKRIFRHPRFRNANRDAAVLKLSRPVDGIPRLKLAKVSSGNRLEKPGSYATVAGWGSTVRQPGDDPSFPVRMREARIPIQRDSYAQYVYNDYFNRQIETYVPETMIAAGYTGKDTCQGDSGGPLIKQVNRNGKKVHVQIGITSWGYGCGQPRIPGVYAEVNSKQIAPFIKGAARK